MLNYIHLTGDLLSSGVLGSGELLSSEIKNKKLIPLSIEKKKKKFS